jgi:RNA polymerase sigma factor (sigma-70 family)
MTATVTSTAPTDMDLVNAFVRSRDQAAFAQLVRRHVDMVYAAALRRVRGDRHLAEDVTQATFIILARRASAFDERTLVAGWLHRAAGYAASNALKTEARRQAHEKRAAENAMRCAHESQATDDRWDEVEHLLDGAMDGLSATDRAAVVMRFHQSKSVEETASALGVSTEAAKKRLQRAVAKLRSILSRKGVRVPTVAALATTIASHASAAAAPEHLAERATSAALEALVSGASTAAALSTPLLIAKGALTMMLWTKIKLAALVGAVVIVLAGAGALAVSQASSPNAKSQAPAQSKYVFGDVIERIVNDDGLRKDECIDFDTGKLHTGPEGAFSSREQGRAWFRSTGADAHGETEEGETGLWSVEMALLPLDNDQWEGGDPAELRDMIAEGRGALELMSGDGDLPQTYLFRTREGSIGVCQILKVARDAEQHGKIAIRYKLIKESK